MPTPISNVNLTNTFDYWIQRSNEAFSFITGKAVSVNSAAAVGHAFINGSVTSNILYTNAISGGNSTVNSTISITAPTTTFTGNVAVNGTASFTSNVSFNNITAAGVLGVNSFTLATNTKSLTTNSSTQSVIDAVSSSVFKTVKYTAQVVDSNTGWFRSSEMLLTHNGSTVIRNEYAVLNSNNEFVSFDADISGGNIRLLFTPNFANTTNKTIKVVRQAISL
jgi:hypothetical protein